MALALDVLKGLLPVALAYHGAGIENWNLLPIAIAPILGHAFSPYLGFRGGKAIATTFGGWAALTLWEVPILLGLLMLLFYKLLDVDAWAMVLAFLPIGAFVLLRYDSLPFLAIWALNWAVMLYKHRQDLGQPPHLRRATEKAGV